MKMKNDLSILASVQTDVGCVREVNEDSVRHFAPGDAEQFFLKGAITIVADGMGGHASGEIASRMAIEIVPQVYYADKSGGSPADALGGAVEEANRRIYQASVGDPKLNGMGTTCTALVLHDGRALAAHVGDSRLYLLRGGDLLRLTEDHSHVVELVKRGVISADEARHHADKNVILRALGTQPEVEVSMLDSFAVKPNDEFLLCSDGLCDMLDDAEIQRVLFFSSDPHTACEQLLDCAKKRGGHDNITVAVVKIASAGELFAAHKIRVTREAEAIN